MILKRIELPEICDTLPSIQPYKPLDSSERPDDLFICSCGFEDRALTIPSELSKIGNYRTKYSIILNHETNAEDNEVNRPTLSQFLESFSLNKHFTLTFSQENFVSEIHKVLQNLTATDISRVSIDITACSTQMITALMRILFNEKISLRILYTEAAVYHPTQEEYNTPENWTLDGKGASRGIVTAIGSCLYHGNNMSELPILLVAFPTFKSERIRSIQSELQPTETIWILGIPHFADNVWRKDAMSKINEIADSDRTYDIKTFDYIDTFCTLEEIYSSVERSHHLIISPHGSKFQTIGVSLFCMLHQDVALWFSVPQSFNPAQYSSGHKDMWQINFGNVLEVADNVRSCHKLKIVSN